MKFDVAIVGGGPAGYSAALEAAGHKLKTVLFEREEMGGTCLNEGCIPLKSFLHVSKTVRQADNLGSSLNIDMSVITDISRNNVEKLKKGLLYSLNQECITIVREEVAEIEKMDYYSLKTEKGCYKALHLIIATGSVQVIPQIQGMEQALQKGRAVTSRDFFRLKSVPEHIAILGAGVVGIEIASFFTDLGKNVTLIDSEERILKDLDEDVYTFYMGRLKSRGIEFLLGVQVCELDASDDMCIVFRQRDEIDEIHADLMILAAGRKPITKFNHVEGALICGDAGGKSMLAHSAMREGKTAVDRILGKEDKMDYDKIPHVIYSTPEAAWIGRGESKQKDKKGIEIMKKSLDYSSRYVIESDGIQGIVKKIFQNRTLQGCQVVGDGAAELISFLGLQGLGNDVIFPHPSVAEIMDYL